MKFAMRFLTVTALVLGTAGTATAANLLVNPDFDSDLANWNPTNASQGTATFDGSDGSPSAGSVLFTGVACCTVQVLQCVAVSAGQSYDFGAVLKQGPVAPGQAGDGMGIDVTWYDAANCSGSDLATDTLAPSVTTSWVRYAKGNVVAPPGAQSASYRIRQYNFAGLTNLTSHADHAFFGASGTVPVELQSFNVD